MYNNASNGTSVASPRPVWEKRISVLIDQARQHTSSYTEKFGSHKVLIHPSVYSPKYFPEKWWHAQQLPSFVNKGRFLEVGVGSGLISLAVASAGSPVVGVDVNPEAAKTTRKNFEGNHLEGTFLVSNMYANVQGRFDCIFWNHPWQVDSAIPEQLKSEKTFDSEYKLLKRFIGEAKEYLTEKGANFVGN